MTQHMYIFFLFLMFHLWFCPILLDVKINLYQCQCQCHGRPQGMRQEKTIAPPPTLEKSSNMFLRVRSFFSSWGGFFLLMGVFFSMWVDFFSSYGGPFLHVRSIYFPYGGRGGLFWTFHQLQNFRGRPWVDEVGRMG